MEWIEVIQLKSFSNKDRENALGVVKKLPFESFKKGLLDVNVYLNHILKGDLSISFHWKKAEPDIMKSRLGLQIASVCSKFGWVNHTVWECSMNVKFK